MSIALNPSDPIVTGDTSVSVYYRMTDADGAVWRSPQAILANALRGDGVHPGGGSLMASGEWVRVPTLRHLMPGTVAQVELYVQRDGADLQLFAVYPNDPTVDYFDVCLSFPFGTDLTAPQTAQSVDAILAAAGDGEIDPSTGDALQNDPPPQCSCIAVWRNRAVACRGNSIYPSQEFATGLGIQWSNNIRVQWDEGTGDIIAVCAIDWNYLAVFKEDAIGIISGPGPDGLGHGNYIIQTLLTKAGTVNPKSVVNGADGCYFQDRATKRLMLVTPQLQVGEATPGWFNFGSVDITCAMQVESRRQVWFATEDGQIVILDYKHRDDGAQLGEVFTWSMSNFGTVPLPVYGMAIVGGIPVVAFSDGAMATYTDAQGYDQLSAGTQKSILQDLETGDLAPFGLQGHGDISRIVMLGEFISKHAVSLTVTPNYGTANDPVEITIDAEPEQFSHRPPNCQRVQSVSLRFQEREAMGGGGTVVLGGGFKFNGVGLEVQARGQLKHLDVGRNI